MPKGWAGRPRVQSRKSASIGQPSESWVLGRVVSSTFHFVPSTPGQNAHSGKKKKNGDLVGNSGLKPEKAKRPGMPHYAQTKS